MKLPEALSEPPSPDDQDKPDPRSWEGRIDRRVTRLEVLQWFIFVGIGVQVFPDVKAATVAVASVALSLLGVGG